MKKTSLSLSLLIGASLTIPSLAVAAPADSAAKNTATTLELAAKDDTTNNNASANQSNPFQISETQKISRAKINSNAGQQAMKAEQQAIQIQNAASQNSDVALQQDDTLEEALLQEDASLETEEDLATTEAL